MKKEFSVASTLKSRQLLLRKTCRLIIGAKLKKKLSTKPGSQEIKIKHTYKIQKQLSNSFHKGKMVLLKAKITSHLLWT